MEVFLRILLKRMNPDCTVRVHAFSGKSDLLKNLQNRLRGYQR